MPKVTDGKKRSRRVTVSVREDTYERIASAADDLGLSVSAWCAYTLSTAAANHSQMRLKMTDQMVALMAEAIAEGVADGTLPTA